MGLKSYVKVFPGILINPTRAFNLLTAKNPTLSSMFTFLGFPVLLLGAYGRVLGEVKISDPNLLPPMVALIATHFLVLCIGVFLGSLMLAKLSPRYGVEANYVSMAKISMVSFIPICLALFVSGLDIGGHYLALAGLFASLFLLGKGLRVVFDFPPNRLLGFVFIAFLIFAGVMFFCLFLLRSFLGLIY